jgi:hypothetical protein
MGVNESLLLHDVHGELVRVTQDGGNPNMTVWDWGQQRTRDLFMSAVDTAFESGITSFFLDKASTSATTNSICNHICDEITPEAAAGWNDGHVAVLRAVANKSTGPTVGNGGIHLCTDMMGGCHSSYSANKHGIEGLLSDCADSHISSIFAQFPVTPDGYAAFLQGYTPGRAWLWWYSATPTWIAPFDHRLGAPLGPAILTNSVYTRKFTRGAHVSFDIRTSKGSFVWTN